ncbi:MAG: thioredoxin family protein [Gemmatimonadota bacterium]|nr:thioredoxin family protein [Gemmatimonadota bacterium]
MSAIALTFLVSATSAVCPTQPAQDGPIPASVVVERSDHLEELYKSGITFDAFFDDADRRRELWVKNYTEGSVAAEMVARVEALEGRWRLLAVAEDWCSDSVNTVPFLALLAEQASNLEIRILDSDRGRELMEAHRTPDDRAATPTVLVLDDDYEDVGCFVERPADLQAWALDARPRLPDSEFLVEKMSWYEEDGGVSTVREIVEALEAAAAGSPLCAGTEGF